MAINRVVVDSSVLVEYLISPRGPSALVIKKLTDNKVELIFSSETLGEIRQVISRSKFDKYLSQELRANACGRIGS